MARILRARCTIFVLALLGASSCGSGSAARGESDGGSPDAMDAEDATACGARGLRPTERDAHGAVYLPFSHRVLVYGGDIAPFNPMAITPSVYVDELWSYDLRCNTWSNLHPPPGPGQRGAFAAVLDEKRNRMLVMGGRKNDAGYQLLRDVWAYDAVANAWQELHPLGSAPSPRQGHRAVYDAAKDRVVLFGGNGAPAFGAMVLDDTWELSFAEGPDGGWRSLGASGPSARQDMGTAIDRKRNLWIMFGGASDFSAYGNDTWAFDLGSSTWKEITVAGVRPSGRFWGAMAEDAARDRFVLFGGHDDSPIGLVNDSWSLDLAADATTATFAPLRAGDRDLTVGGVARESPERRSKQAMVGVGASAWLFGGIGDCGPLDDVWTLDLAMGSWMNTWSALLGETCARRAMPSQICPTDCGKPQ